MRYHWKSRHTGAGFGVWVGDGAMTNQNYNMLKAMHLMSDSRGGDAQLFKSMTAGIMTRGHGYGLYDAIGNFCDILWALCREGFSNAEQRVDWIAKHSKKIHVELMKSENMIDWNETLEKYPYLPTDKWVDMDGIISIKLLLNENMIHDLFEGGNSVSTTKTQYTVSDQLIY